MSPPLDLGALPKVQLHCHLEGTVAPRTFRELARKHGLDLGARVALPDERLYEFDDFRSFLLLFRDVSQTLREPGDFARIAREYARGAARANVRYAELFISPSVWTYFQHDLDVRATVAAIRAAFDDARRADPAVPIVALICDVTRNFGPERAMQTARTAADLAEFGVIGIGLGGDEANFAAPLFADVFDFARARALHAVAHAGEAAGARSVRDAIEVLGAERIGHGVRALEDPAVVDLVRDRRIPLEICPTSNHRTGAADPALPHPLIELDRRGVVCVLDADDPELFGTTLCDEYALAAAWLGEPAALRLARNAVAASFAPGALKASLAAELDRFAAGAGLEPAHPRRT